MTHRVAFTLQLPASAIPEYKRRHDEIWGELTTAIRAQGVHNYSIFAAPHLDVVFGYLEVDDLERWKRSGEDEVTRRWWAYMADVMPTNPDKSPIQADLQPVFHLD